MSKRTKCINRGPQHHVQNGMIALRLGRATKNILPDSVVNLIAEFVPLHPFCELCNIAGCDTSNVSLWISERIRLERIGWQDRTETHTHCQCCIQTCDCCEEHPVCLKCSRMCSKKNCPNQKLCDDECANTCDVCGCVQCAEESCAMKSCGTCLNTDLCARCIKTCAFCKRVGCLGCSIVNMCDHCESFVCGHIDCKVNSEFRREDCHDVLCGICRTQCSICHSDNCCDECVKRCSICKRNDCCLDCLSWACSVCQPVAAMTVPVCWICAMRQHAMLSSTLDCNCEICVTEIKMCPSRMEAFHKAQATEQLALNKEVHMKV